MALGCSTSGSKSKASLVNAFLLEALLLAAYSFFPSEMLGGSGKYTDFIPGELIWMYFDVCN